MPRRNPWGLTFWPTSGLLLLGGLLGCRLLRGRLLDRLVGGRLVGGLLGRSLLGVGLLLVSLLRRRLRLDLRADHGGDVAGPLVDPGRTPLGTRAVTLQRRALVHIGLHHDQVGAVQ